MRLVQRQQTVDASGRAGAVAEHSEDRQALSTSSRAGGSPGSLARQEAAGGSGPALSAYSLILAQRAAQARRKDSNRASAREPGAGSRLMAPTSSQLGVKPSKKVAEEDQPGPTTMAYKHRVIVNSLTFTMDSLLQNSKKLGTFHIDSDDGSSVKDSLGSISSADDQDLGVIVGGEHSSYFNAIEYVKNKTLQKNERSNQRKKVKKKSTCQRLKNFVCCCRMMPDSRTLGEHGQNNSKDGSSGTDSEKSERLGSGERQEEPDKKEGAFNFKIPISTSMDQHYLSPVRASVSPEFATKSNAMQHADEVHERTLLHKIQEFLERLRIDQKNKKLRYFRCLASLAFIVDFMVSCLLIANYDFLTGRESEKDFLNHRTVYSFVIPIHALDMLSRFFIFNEEQEKKSLYQTAKEYVSGGSFILNVVSSLPYSTLRPNWMFLRLIRIFNTREYLQFINEIFQTLLSRGAAASVSDLVNLSGFILFTFHIFACGWVLIGMMKLEETGEGWIKPLLAEKILNNHFQEIYLASYYFVITTFTSVGYGEIKGNTKTELLFQLVLEVFGIGFFGYMTGTIQTVLLGLQNPDQLAEQQSKIHHFLIALDKSIKSSMPSVIFQGVENYFNLKFKNDPMMVQHTELFQQLKPRLRMQILDTVFKNFYSIFNDSVGDFDKGFQRDLFSNVKYKFCLPKYQGEEQKHRHRWYELEDNSVILRAEQKAKKFYLILTGQIHIMDKTGLLRYGLLQEGSYFGDISILFDEPSEFSYYYDPYFREQPLQLLSIEASKFQEILARYPLTKEQLYARAEKRRRMFQNYKSLSLLKVMKSIRKTCTRILTNANAKSLASPGRRWPAPSVPEPASFRCRQSLCEAFYEQYQLSRRLNRRQKNPDASTQGQLQKYIEDRRESTHVKKQFKQTSQHQVIRTSNPSQPPNGPGLHTSFTSTPGQRLPSQKDGKHQRQDGSPPLPGQAESLAKMTPNGRDNKQRLGAGPRGAERPLGNLKPKNRRTQQVSSGDKRFPGKQPSSVTQIGIKRDSQRPALFGEEESGQEFFCDQITEESKNHENTSVSRLQTISSKSKEESKAESKAESLAELDKQKNMEDSYSEESQSILKRDGTVLTSDQNYSIPTQVQPAPSQPKAPVNPMDGVKLNGSLRLKFLIAQRPVNQIQNDEYYDSEPGQDDSAVVLQIGKPQQAKKDRNLYEGGSNSNESSENESRAEMARVDISSTALTNHPFKGFDSKSSNHKNRRSIFHQDPRRHPLHCRSDRSDSSQSCNMTSSSGFSNKNSSYLQGNKQQPSGSQSASSTSQNMFPKRAINRASSPPVRAVSTHNIPATALNPRRRGLANKGKLAMLNKRAFMKFDLLLRQTNVNVGEPRPGDAPKRKLKLKQVQKIVQLAKMHYLFKRGISGSGENVQLTSASQKGKQETGNQRQKTGLLELARCRGQTTISQYSSQTSSLSATEAALEIQPDVPGLAVPSLGPRSRSEAGPLVLEERLGAPGDRENASKTDAQKLLMELVQQVLANRKRIKSLLYTYFREKMLEENAEFAERERASGLREQRKRGPAMERAQSAQSLQVESAPGLTGAGVGGPAGDSDDNSSNSEKSVVSVMEGSQPALGRQNGLALASLQALKDPVQQTMLRQLQAQVRQKVELRAAQLQAQSQVTTLLDTLIEEYISLPLIKFHNFERNRNAKKKNAAQLIEAMEKFDQNKNNLISHSKMRLGLRAVLKPEKNPVSLHPIVQQRVQQKIIDEEIEAARNEPEIMDAIKVEYQQNQVFSEIQTKFFSDINSWLRQKTQKMENDLELVEAKLRTMQAAKSAN